jgi:multicopper oxidase
MACKGSGVQIPALVQLDDGAFPLVAVAEGKSAQALAVVRIDRGPAPGPASGSRSSAGASSLTADDLEAAADVELGPVAPDRPKPVGPGREHDHLSRGPGSA